MDARRTKAVLVGLVANASVLLLVAVVSQVQVHRLRVTVNGLGDDVSRLQTTVAQREAAAADLHEPRERRPRRVRVGALSAARAIRTCPP